jgi:hypothetical protein
MMSEFEGLGEVMSVANDNAASVSFEGLVGNLLRAGAVDLVRLQEGFQYVPYEGLAEEVAVAEPPELSRLKCAGHHHKGNTGTNALQTEQFLVCRVTSRYNHRFSDRTSIPRTKASPEILQPQVLHHRHKSYYKPVLKYYYKTNLSKQLYKP